MTLAEQTRKSPSMSVNKLCKSIAVNLFNWSPYFLAMPGWFSALKDTDTLQKWRECAGHRNESLLSAVIYRMGTLGPVSINLSLATWLASESYRESTWRALNYAACSSQLWGAVGALCQGCYGGNTDISCTFRLHGMYHISMQTWLKSLPQPSMGLKQPSGSKQQEIVPLPKDQAYIPDSGAMRWDQFLSFPVFL